MKNEYKTLILNHHFSDNLFLKNLLSGFTLYLVEKLSLSKEFNVGLCSIKYIALHVTPNDLINGSIGKCREEIDKVNLDVDLGNEKTLELQNHLDVFLKKLKALLSKSSSDKEKELITITLQPKKNFCELPISLIGKMVGLAYPGKDNNLHPILF
jgi:hypothetical protein